MLAVAVLFPTVVRRAATVMGGWCSDAWSSVLVAGVMAIVASTHVLLAGPLLPAVPFVVRVTEPASVSGMEEVRSEERRVGEEGGMSTVQLAVEQTPV